MSHQLFHPWKIDGQPLLVVIEVPMPVLEQAHLCVQAVGRDASSVTLTGDNARIVLYVARRSDDLAADIVAQIAETREAWRTGQRKDQRDELVLPYGCGPQVQLG